MDKNEMKIQALKEGFSSRLANITAEYEDKIADLRIALTELTQESQQRINELTERVQFLEAEKEAGKSVLEEDGKEG